MRVLLATSELFPYSKTGGLADMVGALAKFLARAGHEVSVVTPLYRGLRERYRDLVPTDWSLRLPLHDHVYTGGVWRTTLAEGQTLYFIDQPEFFQRPALYGERGGEYPDNARRFAFLSKAVVHLARHLARPPELVHVHDWHLGWVPLLIRHQARLNGWAQPPRTIITIHNLAYQGVSPAGDYLLANVPWDYFTPDGAEFYGQFNALKTGLAFADQITTVSPTYAAEIQTSAFGCNLEGLLRARADVLTGILNGVDYEEWRTHDNPYLAAEYDFEHLAGKELNKRSLQAELSLPARPEVPLFAAVTRLAHQKGIDLSLQALDELLEADVQFALLGSGWPDFEQGFLALQERHPTKVGLHLGYDHGLSHRIEAGADFFVMPSQFEPCGLNQMYSLRYGTVPIVRATGGLMDSVVDVREDPDAATGIKFDAYAAPALTKAMRKALALYDAPDLLRHYQHNGMTADFSWEKTTVEYEALYAQLLDRPPDAFLQPSPSGPSGPPPPAVPAEPAA